MSTSRSSVYDASLAAPLMSASAWATARIARESPASDQSRDWSRMVRSFHGGTPTSRARSASRCPRGAPRNRASPRALPANAEVTSTGAVPASSAQRSSSRAASRRPENAASATANDLASARPPK